MNGTIILAGGAEFGGRMAEVDREAIRLAGGSSAPIRIIPTAAAPDNNYKQAGNNGVQWFTSLGARDVRSLPLIDRQSAEDPAIVKELRSAKLIYLLGGFPVYLARTLENTAAWQACQAAFEGGAVIAGSSAGAMVLCEHLYDPGRDSVTAGLGLVHGACVIPHHNTFGSRWAPSLMQRLPETLLLGIDEQTALVSRPEQRWRVFGASSVTRYLAGATVVTIPNGGEMII